MCETTLMCPLCAREIGEQEETSCHQIDKTVNRQYVCPCGALISVQATLVGMVLSRAVLQKGDGDGD